VVRDHNGFREMLAIDGTEQLIWTRASLDDPTKSGWPYADLFHLAPALAARRGRALFIGCGGGVSLHQFAFRYPGVQLDLVEHEPAVLKLAEDWFALDSVPNLTKHIADGHSFVENSPDSRWDIIIVDAYDTQARSSDGLQYTCLRGLRRVLRPGGAIAWNLIGSLAGVGPIANFLSLASKVFDTVRVVPVIDVREDYAAETLRNIVVVAS
jgi:spermidine synthase